MTPIQQAIEQVEKDIVDYNQIRNGWKKHSSQWEVYDLMVRQLAKTLAYLQSLLPVEKEWAHKTFGAGWNHFKWTGSPDFEQYYSQFNEVK